MYCTCKGSSFTAMKVDGVFNYQFWVCADCNKPSALVFRKVTNMRGPITAKLLLNLRYEKDGMARLSWLLANGSRVETLQFHPYPRKVGMDTVNNTESKLFLMWELLQSKLVVVLRPVEGAGDNDVQKSERDYAKVQARAVCETLALLTAPFMADADAVGKHAVKYYKAQLAGEQYEVPGLGLVLWNPMKNWDGSDRTPLAEPARETRKAVARPKPTAKKLSDDEIDGIKNAVNSGMFTVKECASMFKVSTEAVEAIMSA